VRENCMHGSEGGAANARPYPYQCVSERGTAEFNYLLCGAIFQALPATGDRKSPPVVSLRQAISALLSPLKSAIAAISDAACFYWARRGPRRHFAV
jgi:hypothetical protein